MLLDSLVAKHRADATRGPPITDDQLAFRLVMMTSLTLSGRHENDWTGRPVDKSTSRLQGIHRSRSRFVRRAGRKAGKLSQTPPHPPLHIICALNFHLRFSCCLRCDYVGSPSPSSPGCTGLYSTSPHPLPAVSPLDVCSDRWMWCLSFPSLASHPHPMLQHLPPTLLHPACIIIRHRLCILVPCSSLPLLPSCSPSMPLCFHLTSLSRMHRPSSPECRTLPPAVKSHTGKALLRDPSPVIIRSSLHRVVSMARPRGSSYHIRPASSLVPTRLSYPSLRDLLAVTPNPSCFLTPPLASRVLGRGAYRSSPYLYNAPAPAFCSRFSPIIGYNSALCCHPPQCTASTPPIASSLHISVIPPPPLPSNPIGIYTINHHRLLVARHPAC
ncbi:hypothetical protein LXA43DRAFT_226851 [Ganoderma leucocontextum]|nr:hypothetical protein LXA43DRAFT_226851 [Ganoderma leucocontextum]